MTLGVVRPVVVVVMAVMMMVFAVVLAVVAWRVVGPVPSLCHAAEADRQRHRGNTEKSGHSLDHSPAS
jgi:nitrate/nitrite-specific signal transduction histidine kinase